MAVISLSNITTKPILRIPTKYPWLDTLYGGGLPEGLVSTWAGESGVGKSRLMLDLCSKFTADGQTVLYNVNEVTHDQLGGWARPFKMVENRFFLTIGAERDPSIVYGDILRMRPDVVVIDSLTMLDGFGGRGTARIIDKFKEIAAQIKCHIIMIAQFTQMGKVAGGAKAVYNADVVCHLRKVEDREGMFYLKMEKNRSGPSGGYIVFKHNKVTKGIDCITSTCDPRYINSGMKI